MQTASQQTIDVKEKGIPENKRGITANMIKIIAIIAMLIDHITWDYIPTNSLQGQLLHVIGRLTAPIMSFFIVEGFFHTRNLKKYTMRLFIFSILSYFAYQYHTFGEFFLGFKLGSWKIIVYNSVIFTLLLGLISLILWYKTNLPKWMKILGILGLCALAWYSDWSIIGVLWVFFMGINHGNFKAQMIALAVVGTIGDGLMMIMTIIQGNPLWWVNLCQFGVVFAIPVLYLYNGKLGKSKNMKWLFYIFYPLHLLILGYIKFYIV